MYRSREVEQKIIKALHTSYNPFGQYSASSYPDHNPDDVAPLNAAHSAARLKGIEKEGGEVFCASSVHKQAVAAIVVLHAVLLDHLRQSGALRGEVDVARA